MLPAQFINCKAYSQIAKCTAVQLAGLWTGQFHTESL